MKEKGLLFIFLLIISKALFAGMPCTDAQLRPGVCEQPACEITFAGAQKSSLQYHIKSMPLAGSDDPSGGQSKTSEKGISNDVKNFWKTNELLIGLSLVVLLGLIVFFIWRRKKPGKNNIDPIP